MRFRPNPFSRFLKRFRKDEDGGPTVEFVLIFVPLFMLVVSAFELGLLMTRHVMLERGLDMAVREVRLNTGAPVDEDTLQAMVCNAAGIIPNCDVALRLEMRPVNMWVSGGVGSSVVPRDASCTNVDTPFEPARNFSNGAANEVMIVRACGVFAPMLPTFGLGYFLAQGPQERYRLVSSSAFVMEPV